MTGRSGTPAAAKSPGPRVRGSRPVSWPWSSRQVERRSSGVSEGSITMRYGGAPRKQGRCGLVFRERPAGPLGYPPGRRRPPAGLPGACRAYSCSAPGPEPDLVLGRPAALPLLDRDAVGEAAMRNGRPVMTAGSDADPRVAHDHADRAVVAEPAMVGDAAMMLGRNAAHWPGQRLGLDRPCAEGQDDAEPKYLHDDAPVLSPMWARMDPPPGDAPRRQNGVRRLCRRLWPNFGQGRRR